VRVPSVSSFLTQSSRQLDSKGRRRSTKIERGISSTHVGPKWGDDIIVSTPLREKVPKI